MMLQYVKKDLVPGAAGDGQTDDTAAIQKALSGLRDGSVLYFPPGIYRITSPLSLKNPAGDRWTGGLIIGSGRDTKLVWDGFQTQPAKDPATERLFFKEPSSEVTLSKLIPALDDLRRLGEADLRLNHPELRKGNAREERALVISFDLSATFI